MEGEDQGEQGDGDEGGDGRVAEEAEAERGHIAAAHRATEPGVEEELGKCSSLHSFQ